MVDNLKACGTLGKGDVEDDAKPKVMELVHLLIMDESWNLQVM